MKKIILSLFVVTTLFSCSSKKKEVLFLGSSIGGYVDYLKEHYDDINSSFVMKKSYSSYLYSLLVKDGKDLLNNKSISDSIKNAERIYIQIGNDDFLRCVEQVENMYLIDEENLNTQKELFSYYYFLIVEEIRLIYEGNIILLSPYLSISNKNLSMSIFDKALTEFYEVAKEVGAYFSCDYIDIREINLFIDENNDFQKEGFSYLDNLVKYGN